MSTTIANTENVRSSCSLPSEALLLTLDAGSEVVVPVTELSPALHRDDLILQHMGTVRIVARRVYERMPQHLDFEELVSAGIVGLIDAASKFDLSKQVQFPSYAQFRIRGAILDSLRTLDWSPRELRRKGREMAEAIRTLSAQLGRTPSDEEIASEMSMTLTSFQQITGELTSLKIESLNEERTEESGDEEIEFLTTPASEDPLLLCIQKQSKEQLSALIEALPEKERLVVTLYYFEELTLREIGAVLGVGESRVSQIRSTAQARIKKALHRESSASGGRARGKAH